MSAPNTTLLIEFETNDTALADHAQEIFVEEETVRSSGFDGAIVVSVITLAATVIRLAFKFYAKHLDSLRSAKLTIDGKKVSFSGFSSDEINEMVERGNVEKIIEKLNKKE